MTQYTLVCDNSSGLAANLARVSSKENLELSLEQIKEYSSFEGKMLNLLARVITDRPVSNPVLATFSNSSFNKLYYPKLAQKEGVMGLAWGSEFYPLILGKGNDLKSFLEGYEAEIEIVTSSFDGYDKSTVASFTVLKTGSEDLFTIILGVRWLDPKAVSEKGVTTTAIKRNRAEFIGLLDEPAKPFLTAYASTQLPVGKYQVTGYNLAKTKDGTREYALLTVESVTLDQGEPSTSVLLYAKGAKLEDEPSIEQNGAFSVYAPNAILGLLNRKPDISPEKPATYLVLGRSANKKGTVKVSDTLSLHPDTVFTVVQSELPDIADLDI